ncbi:MAG TPA: hypothetical protein VF925_14820 [Casimicrobiaceae bacterium]
MNPSAVPPATAVPVLLVATATKWPGTARIPRALSRAGFEVSLLAPRGSLAEHSRFVDRIAYLPEASTPLQWVHAFAATVAATSPRLAIPCDDMALRLMQRLAVAPPPQLKSTHALRLAALVRMSLGDPAHFETTSEKTLLGDAAQALGIGVPPSRVCRRVADALAFADMHGWPMVVKRAHGFAGQGVAICADRVSLDVAFAGLAEDERRDRIDANAGEPALVVQSLVRGPTQYYMGVAYQGRLLAGYAGEKVVAHPEPNGPPTVARYFRSPRLREITARLLHGFSVTGFFVAEFRLDEASGEPLLLELTRRMSPVTHRSADRDVDLCAALHAELSGTVSPSRVDLDDGENGYVVFFPGEWLRDPQSPWLRRQPVDVPWDEPELLAAMMKLRLD